ncbi:hypothetical protein BH11ACT8_BH11ACT8_07590 [soil metagenome]
MTASVTDTVPAPPALHEHGPGLMAVLRRLAVSLSVAVVVPALLFYAVFVSLGLTSAILAALGWSYGAIAWRRLTHRPTSGLLVLTATVLTIRTVFTLSTGNTFVYFLQPVVSDGVVAVVFLLSLATARPLVSRLAADFYPMSEHTASHPRVRCLFWRLTLMWGGVCLLKGLVGYWLLESLSVSSFVLVKSSAMIAMTACAVVVTVWASARAMRHDGVLVAACTRP